MNPHIFRQYDIRGDASADLGDDFAEDLGRAIGSFQIRAGNRRLVLGRDCRLSSPRLHTALLKGLRTTGVDLVDIGVVPTPMMYFTVFYEALDGGVMITGSHNPPKDNGFKMMREHRSLYGEDIQELLRIMEARDFVQGPEGEYEELDPVPNYINHMRRDIAIPKNAIRFAIDAGNGAGGPTAVKTMTALGLEPVALLCEMDGRFPVHHPDPTQPKNLQLLKDTVLEQNLDVGIAFDGDADRIGVIDQQGNVIWGDRLMVLLSRSVLKKHPGAAILGEVKCSQTMYDEIARHGGRPILWKTGHSLIKAKMKEEGALLAGEMSGHIFFADRYFGFDDAVYAALRLIEILAEEGKPLHELLSDVPVTYNTPEIRVPCPDDEKFDVVARVLAHYQATHEVVDVDGARVLFEGGWGLVRASNTQPVLVLRFEADTDARLTAIREEVEAVVSSARAAS
jgi:phosphomannomutase/phosphoglucomutase